MASELAPFLRRSNDPSRDTMQSLVISPERKRTSYMSKHLQKVMNKLLIYRLEYLKVAIFGVYYNFVPINICYTGIER